jgi:hypothetical protein
LLSAQEVVRRHRAGESVRVIARAVGLPRTSVHRIIQEYRRARDASPLERELDAELDALLSRYEGGFDAETFDIADADPELVARLVANGVDITDPASTAVIAALTRDPTNALAKWRAGHLPRTAEWLAGHDMLGRPLLDSRLAGGPG